METLAKLLTGVDYTGAADFGEIKIKGVATDSRRVKEGDLFICIRGTNSDGHRYALEAQMLGAAAVVAEKSTESGLPTVIVTNSRQAYSKICQNFFKNPNLSLKIVTVVGTNGKTTTSYIAEHLLKSAGYKTGVIGTIGYKILDTAYEADLTTPDSFVLNRLLAKMVQAGVEIVIMEVSAHAIAQDRLFGIKSDISIFTNLSQDHLDYFGTFEAYSDTKLSFFTNGCTKSAIVNTDDGLGGKIFKSVKMPIISYGIDEPSDVFAIDIRRTDKGSSFVINLFDEIYEMSTPLYGKHNVYNVLAAVTLAKLLKVPTPLIAESLQKLPRISGRFNIFLYKNAKIVVDFAHTPDGLRNLLIASRPLAKGKLVLVFGCGGNRDAGKRRIMGDIASRLADTVIVTEDNSRNEETRDIIAEIMKGIKSVVNVFKIENRREAIRYAAGLLGDGDLLVIAGKGAEEYIEKKGRRVKFSDIAEVTALTRGDK